MLKRIKKTYKRTYTKRKKASILDQGNCFLSESEDKKRRKHLSYFLLGIAALLVIIPCLFLLKTRIEQEMFIASKQEVLEEQKMKEQELREKNKPQMQEIFSKMKELRKQADEIRLQNKKEFEAILTPEQKETLEKMQKEHHEKIKFKKHKK